MFQGACRMRVGLKATGRVTDLSPRPLRSGAMSDSGAATAGTFSEKWNRNPDLAFAQTLDERSEILRWILTRNGFASGKGLLPISRTSAASWTPAAVTVG